MNANQLQNAIALGLGRAIMHVRDHDVHPFREIILDACLHNQAYDPQMEGSRAVYIKDLMHASGDEAFFAKAVVDSLAQETDVWDMVQRFRLAGLLARDGNPEARAAMQQAFRGKAISAGDIASAFTELDGIAGLLFAAGRIGKSLKQNTRQWEDDSLLSFACQTLGNEAVESALNNAAASDVNVRTYLAAVNENRRLRVFNQSPDLKKLGFTEIKALIEGSDAVGILHAWAEQASDAEMLLAARSLNLEQDARKIRLYLTLFRKRQFPLGPERLFELVELPDGPIPRRTVNVLADLKDDRIRRLAFKFVETGSTMRYCAINLLVQNFQPGDHETMEAWCDVERDPETVNAFGRSLQNFFVRHPDPEREARVLSKLYEKEPCAHCRCATIKRLLALNALPDDLRKESAFDSYADTRALFAVPTNS